MFTRSFRPHCLFRHLFGTETFVEYCRSRAIPFEHVLGTTMRDGDYERWQTAAATLPESAQARVELELQQVNEMAYPEAVEHLLAAARERGPPPDAIPGTAALALWFFLHHPDLFHEAFLLEGIEENGAWRIARTTPGIVLDDLPGKQAALAESLKEFFQKREGIGRFCAAEHYHLAAATCFVVHLSDRLQLIDVFTENGEHTTQRTRPAFPVLFAYYPDDGFVFLKARQRAADKVLDLFQRFGRTVLGVELDQRSLAPVFHLDVFKRKFDPLLDPDMEQARVKAIHLFQPERTGRRRIKLETLSGDEQFAILDLLKIHRGGGEILDQLAVSYVELEIKLSGEGWCRHFVVRLWPDRCNLSQTALGERLRACLKRWGVYESVGGALSIPLHGAVSLVVVLSCGLGDDRGRVGCFVKPVESGNLGRLELLMRQPRVTEREGTDPSLRTTSLPHPPCGAHHVPSCPARPGVHPRPARST
jgi:hypothetical protein